MKKIKIGDIELAKALINKILESFNVDYDWVIANQEVDGRPWFQHFEWTQEESDNYKKWFIEFFQKNVSPRLSKKILEKEWQWFNLMYGLKIKDE